MSLTHPREAAAARDFLELHVGGRSCSRPWSRSSYASAGSAPAQGAGRLRLRQDARAQRRLPRCRRSLPRDRQTRRQNRQRTALAPLAPPRLRLAADRKGPKRRLRQPPARALKPDRHAQHLRAPIRAGRPRPRDEGGAGGKLRCDGRGERVRTPAGVVTAVVTERRSGEARGPLTARVRDFSQTSKEGPFRGPLGDRASLRRLYGASPQLSAPEGRGLAAPVDSSKHRSVCYLFSIAIQSIVTLAVGASRFSLYLRAVIVKPVVLLPLIPM